MRSVVLGAALLLAAVSHGSPLFPSEGKLLDKRQGPGSFYPVTGATGGVNPRLEIRDLENAGGEMWNLYLLAMTEFQAMDQDVIDSYYQIAGIHGMPWITWDGVEGSFEGRNVGQMGYCPHNQLLFGTWHRPYLALFEQKLQKVAASIAATFPTATRAKYQAAATKLRIPYWDWAKALPTDQPVVPTSVSNEKAQVTFPNGTSAQIDNPLYDYNFHPLDNTQINGTGCPNFAGAGGVPSVCQNSKQTIRAGSETSDHVTLNKNLRAILTSQRTSLYSILSQYQTFTQIASGSVCDGLARAGNIETLHNPIHAKHYPGHMSPSGVAAFDPIFWLHHANVDRQIALHQALYPDTYLGSCEAETPTFTIEPKSMLDASSALTPFHKNAAGDFWTSTSSRNIRDMGYTYPELANNPSNATLVASIKAQYSGLADVPVTNTKAKAKREDSKKELYLAEVNLPTYGLDDGNGGAAPYNVLIFLGNVGNDAKEWTTSDSFVGLASTLGGVNIQIDQKVSVPVDLSNALEKAIADGLTSVDEAEDYLKANLHYRLELGNKEIPKEKVLDLEVSLISTQVEIAQSDDTFDRWVGGFKEHGVIDG